MLSFACDFPPFEMPVTIQAYPHRWRDYGRNLIRRGEILALAKSAMVIGRSTNWVQLGKALFDRALQEGGAWHLLGHSWGGMLALELAVQPGVEPTHRDVVSRSLPKQKKFLEHVRYCTRGAEAPGIAKGVFAGAPANGSALSLTDCAPKPRSHSAALLDAGTAMAA